MERSEQRSGQRSDDLDDLFAQARATVPAPSPALLARVLADAQSLQPAPRPVVAAAAGRRPGALQRLAGLLGGVGALAGLGTAAAAGVLIGYVQPQGLDLLGDAMLGAPVETVELVPDLAAFGAAFGTEGE